VVSIAEFTERLPASTHSPEGGSSVG